MASRSTLNVYIEGDAGSLRRAFREASSDVESFGRSMGSTFKATAAGVAIGNLAYEAFVETVSRASAQVRTAVTQASALNEIQNKVNVVFGASAPIITEWGRAADTSIGLSERAALDAAGSFGNLFIQLGLSTDHATDLSTEMVQLAADFASFHDADISQVLIAQQAAFRGEYDAVQRFVPIINAATVEEEALAMGLAKTASELSQQDKALATHALIVKGAGDATGDFARTSDSLANQQRQLQAQVENLQAAIGKALLPVVTDIVTEINRWIDTNGDEFAEDFALAVDKVTEAAEGTLDALIAIRDSGPYRAVVEIVDGEGNLITMAGLAALGFALGGPAGATVGLGVGAGRVAGQRAAEDRPQDWFETAQAGARATRDMFGLGDREGLLGILFPNLGGESPWDRLERQAEHLRAEGGAEDPGWWGPSQGQDPTRPVGPDNPAWRPRTPSGPGTGERAPRKATTGGGGAGNQPDMFSAASLGLIEQITAGLPFFGGALDAAGLEEFRRAESEFKAIRASVNRDLAQLGLTMADLDARGLENTDTFAGLEDRADAMKDALQRIDLIEDLRLTPWKDAIDKVSLSIEKNLEAQKKMSDGLYEMSKQFLNVRIDPSAQQALADFFGQAGGQVGFGANGEFGFNAGSLNLDGVP